MDFINFSSSSFYRIFRVAAIVVGVLILIGLSGFGILIGYLTITDYTPEEIIELDIEGEAEKESVSGELSLISWNIGYAGLGAGEDSFASGGKGVRPDDKKTVYGYLKGITTFLSENQADLYLLQEVDRDSRRSYNIDEYEDIKKRYEHYQKIFAHNYKVKFVPVPFPPPAMGEVESGIALMSRYKIKESARYQFPGKYGWPTYLAHLDRCFTLSRLEVEGKDSELVVINTHNSAFDKEGILRKQQMAYLKKVILKEYESGNYVIVGGDWNQLMPDISKDHFTSNLKGSEWVKLLPENWTPEGWNWGYDKKTPTARATNAVYIEGDSYITSIDAFLISPNVELLKVEVKDLGFEFSDHNPVYIEVKLK